MHPYNNILIEVAVLVLLVVAHCYGMLHVFYPYKTMVDVGHTYKLCFSGVVMIYYIGNQLVLIGIITMPKPLKR